MGNVGMRKLFDLTSLGLGDCWWMLQVRKKLSPTKENTQRSKNKEDVLPFLSKSHFLPAIISN